jgi:hypothetical protein
MFYSDSQSFLNFLRILNRSEVGVFARAIKLESPCTVELHKIQNKVTWKLRCKKLDMFCKDRCQMIANLINKW